MFPIGLRGRGGFGNASLRAEFRSGPKSNLHMLYSIFFSVDIFSTWISSASTPASTEKVFLTDCRDVFFQSDPFAWSQSPGLHVFLEENAKNIGECEFNGRWIRNLFGEAAFQELATRTVSCAGTVFGDEQAVIDYLRRMVRTTMQVRNMRLIDGDQGVHNYLVHTGRLSNLTIYPNRQGPVMTVGPMKFSDLRTTPEGRILNEVDEVPPVLHQYDRIPELTEVLLSKIPKSE